MNSNALVIDFFMEIKKNVQRFLSILLIVALGVAFFSGVRATKPDMLRSADALYDDSSFMDIRIVSTLGFSAEDVQAVLDLKGVKAAEGFYTADVLADGKDGQNVLHMMSYSTTMNVCTVTKGRMPERASECLVDSKLSGDYKIGDHITIASGTKKDVMDTFNVKEYTVVGFGENPYYISRDRGTSSIGDGAVDGFVMVHPMAFALTAYTEIGVQADGASQYTIFTSKYDKAVDKVVGRIEKIQETRSTIRYESVKQTSEDELKKAEADLKAAEQELADSKTRLEQAETELNQAKSDIELKIQEILSGQTTIAEQEAALTEATNQLNQAKAQLDASRADILGKQLELASGKAQLDSSRAALTDSFSDWTNQSNEISSRWSILEQAEQKLNEDRAALNEKKAQLEILKGQPQSPQEEEPQTPGDEETVGFSVLQAYYGAAAEDEAQLPGAEDVEPDPALPTEPQDPQPTEAPPQESGEPSETVPGETENGGAVSEDIAKLEQEIAEQESEIAARESELIEQRSQLESASAALDSTKSQLDSLNAQLESESALYTSSMQEVSIAAAQLMVGEAEYNKQKATLDAGIQALNLAKLAITNGQTSVTSSQVDIAGAEQELLQGKQSYEAAVQESEQKLKDSRAELNEKKRDVAKMAVPEWYILDRGYIASCADFSADADRIGAIGLVFPLLFFLVAALVSLTTVTRMVEEQRTQIGTMKALGFDKRVIAAKYICYALLASVIGAVIGMISGQLILPRIIINAYRILYTGIPKVLTPLHLGYSISSLLVAVLCTSVAAFFACFKELKEVPAQLVRPAPPKSGRRVWMERFPRIWSRLNFSRKAAVRNLFRYKKQFFMALFGVAGCMALLLVAFGLHDSIMTVGDKQFGELTQYDESIALQTTDLKPVRELEEALTQDERVKNHLFAYEAAAEIEHGKVQKSGYLIVTEDGKSISNYITLRTRAGKKALKLTDDGVIISEKLATLLNVGKGDLITLVDSDNYRVEVKVTGITENYYQHFIYMTGACYEMLYGDEPDYNTVLVKNTKLPDKKKNAFITEYNEYEAVGSITNIETNKNHIHDILKSMNTVVVVLIVSAGLLAFVVLYNLNNIAITERRRELASLKVLGFRNKEVTAYVLRENILMTAIGIVLGIVLGIILHQFVVRTAEVDLAMFGRRIHFLSYLFSILLTIVFSAAVNVIMHYKLKKIDMVESLKSVE